MVDQHGGADRGGQLQVGPADRLVPIEIGLVHEVDGERAVRRVAQRCRAQFASARRAPRQTRSPAIRSAAKKASSACAGTGILDPASARSRPERSGRSPIVAKPTPAISGSPIARLRSAAEAVEAALDVLVLRLRRIEPGQHLLPGPSGFPLVAVLQRADPRNHQSRDRPAAGPRPSSKHRWPVADPGKPGVGAELARAARRTLEQSRLVGVRSSACARSPRARSVFAQHLRAPARGAAIPQRRCRQHPIRPGASRPCRGSSPSGPRAPSPAAADVLGTWLRPAGAAVLTGVGAACSQHFRRDRS